MTNWLANLAPAVVGGVLLWAGAIKLLGASAPAAARRSALRRLVGAERVVGVYRVIGGVELCLAAALVLPPAHPAESLAAAALCVGMLGYLGYAKVAAPDSSCGCLGEQHAPVRWRSFARAGLLAIGSGVAVLSSDWWATTVLDRPLESFMVVAAWFAIVVLLSPELDGRWLLPLRRLRVRVSHPLTGAPFEVPLASSVQQLHKSDAYRVVAYLLRSDLLDTWDEGDWRLLTYSARRGSGAATAVFAVPKLAYEPDAVRVVLVADVEAGALV